MAKKNRQKQKQAQQRRERKLSDRNHRRPAPRHSTRRLEATPRLPPLDPPEPQRSLPVLHIDAAGKQVPDPYAELGVPPTADGRAILAAFRDLIIKNPPERDPEAARRLLEATAV